MGKRVFLLLSMTSLLTICLNGCGKDKVMEKKDYAANEVISLQLDVDTWNVDIMASSDEKIHVSFGGSVLKSEDKPESNLKDGVLNIFQKDADDEKLQDQIALGKKGQITLYLPSEYTIPISISNGIGDIEVSSIAVTEFKLDNDAGYVTFLDFTAEQLEALSVSGDITVKNSEISDIEVATSSGYTQINSLLYNTAKLTTKSGEVNISKVSPNTDVTIQTGSGDINVIYQTTPDNLEFGITTGSKDISTSFAEASYTKETSGCRQGTIGNGQYKLKINSDNGTVVVK